MQIKRSILSGVTLAVVAAVGLGSAVMADNGHGKGAGKGMGKGPRGAAMGPAFDLDRIFAEFDMDQDGSISAADIEAWKAAQPRVEDTDGDGKISADELAAPRIAEATKRANDRAAGLVKRLDTDGDGLLSAAELAAGPGIGGAREGRFRGHMGHGMGPSGGPGIEAMLQRLDADGDGAVSREEAETAFARMKDRMENRGPRGGRGGEGGRPPAPPAPGAEAPEGGN